MFISLLFDVTAPCTLPWPALPGECFWLLFAGWCLADSPALPHQPTSLPFLPPPLTGDCTRLDATARVVDPDLSYPGLVPAFSNGLWKQISASGSQLSNGTVSVKMMLPGHGAGSCGARCYTNIRKGNSGSNKLAKIILRQERAHQCRLTG